MDTRVERPRSLPLRSSLRDFNILGSGTRFPGPTWMELLPEVNYRRLLATFKGLTAARSLSKSRRAAILLFVAVFVFLMLLRIPKPPKHIFRTRRCTIEDELYRNGQVLCSAGRKIKYLSYQPPGGGWNNQRIAFENAVIIAKLLNRALIVHPMAPHGEILRAKKHRPYPTGYKSYNSIPEDSLLPLSKVIDLRRLSKLLTLKEVTTSHPQFLDDYKHLSWHRVCHNGLIGFWVDYLPSKQDNLTWNALYRRATEGLITTADLPLYRRSCEADLERYSENNSTLPFWGILNELSNRDEDIIYFEEGSMFFRQMIFLDKKRVLDSHKWIINYVNFAPTIRNFVEFNLRRIGYKFSCMHVRRSDHPSAKNITQKYWLDLLDRRKILDSTKKLYIATDEKDMTWFEPFREAGFRLLFSKDLVNPHEIQQQRIPMEHVTNETFDQDLLGLKEQLLCTHAQFFIGSYYSTFSLYIKRMRKQKKWRGKPLAMQLFGVTWLDVSGENVI